jgi:hypothetical protein
MFLSTKNQKPTPTRKKKVENQTLIKIVNKKVEEGVLIKDPHQIYHQKKVLMVSRLG